MPLFSYKKTYFILIVTILALCSGIVLAQTNPVLGTVQIDLGGIVNGSVGERVVIPVNIDLTDVSATDADVVSVQAALGNYRLAIQYDNTQLKAFVDDGFINGGNTIEFNDPVPAKVIISGSTDILVFSASQINKSLPTGMLNIAQISFDIVGATSGATTLVVSVLDLRTPIVATGFDTQPIVGGVGLNYQAFDTQINVVAATDADNDGLPDAWELLHSGFTIGIDDSRFDFDGDGLSNLDEYHNLTDPGNSDSDGDLVPDGAEVATSNNPLDAFNYPLWIVSPAVINGEINATYSYQIMVNKPDVFFGLSVSPAGMTIVPDSGLITWASTDIQPGLYAVGVSVSGHGEIAEQNYILFVAASGDINADGSINVADLLLLQQHVLGVRTLTAEQQQRADLYVGNGDGAVNIQDMILLNRKILDY